MGPFDKLVEKHKQEWNSHVRDHIRELVAKESTVTLAEYKELRMNSYEREMLVPHLDQDALVYCIEQCLNNIPQNVKRPVITYDQALALVFVPELLKRIK